MHSQSRSTQSTPEPARSGAPPSGSAVEHYCAFCGRAVGSERIAEERFGEVFCSDPHADEFAKGVRAARLQAAARVPEREAGGAEARPAASWRDRLKKSLCWGAPVLLLLAVPLFASGSALAATGGSLLSVLALVACPLGMYFMMRSMASMGHGKDDGQPGNNAPEGKDR